jgi:ABC-2 type transport system permease protein
LRVNFGRFWRVFGALFRLSLAEAAAYRLESLVWFLATTMPLVMLAMFFTVAREAPIGRFDDVGMVAYFLCTFIVRTTTGSWAAWQVNMDIRDGTLAVRLLRPAPPLLSYATDNLAALPLRGIVCIPVAVGMLVYLGGRSQAIARDPRIWLLWAFAMLGAFLLNLLTNLAIGCLAFFLESSLKVMDLYIASFFLLSGYLIPIDIFPAHVRDMLALLPFHFQLGFPVEIMTNAYDLTTTLRLLAIQWTYVAATLGLTRILWRRGLTRFAAFGG